MILLDHPAVQQAITFAMPLAKLGKDVAAPLVLREGRETTEAAIRAFAAERLAGWTIC